MRIGLNIRTTQAAIAAMALTVVPMTALADATAPFFERSLVLAADQKCHLFIPVVTSALTASTWQARGAAARAGLSDIALAETVQRAQERAAGTSCGDPELATVQARVATAFSGWSRIARMTFPGEKAAWTANRSDFSQPTWRLMQSSVTGASPVTFGFVEGGGETQALKAVVSFVGQSRPYAARIVMRDTDRAPHAWLVGAGAEAGGGVATLPPEASRRAFFAAGSLDASKMLLGEGQSQGQAWLFPDAAADALAQLDPREPFIVEFLFRDDSVARARFEAGDFAAGRAFIGMGSL